MPKNIAKVKKTKEEEEEEEQDESILEYNTKTHKSYTSQGLGAPEFLDYQERQFVAAVDPAKKDEIERTVTKIVRVKAIDHSSKKKERKDYIYYYENWNANDWQGVKIAPVTDHVEGYYMEQDTNPIVERNRVTGYKRTGEHQVYYIPFSKEKVDDIIANSVGTDKETIIFTVINGPLSYEFPYEKFVNSTFDELNQLLLRPGGPAAVIASEQMANSTSNAVQELADKARENAKIIVDKEKEEDLTIDKNVVHVEEKNKQQEQEESKNQEKERKIVKPNFGDYKIGDLRSK